MSDEATPGPEAYEFDGEDAGGIDQARALDPFCVFLGDDVVGDHADFYIARLHRRDQALDQRRLARTDRTADADPGDTRKLGARAVHRSI